MPKLDHLSLPVRDCGLSRDWYVRNLGFKVEFEVPQGGRIEMGVVALQDDAGLTVFLEQVMGPVHSGQASYTIQVNDVDALYAELVAKGVEFTASPGKQFWGYGAVLSDPDGHLLHLYDTVSMKTKG